jgi:hypothetical protein
MPTVAATAVTLPLTVESKVATHVSPMTGLFRTGFASPSLPVTVVALEPWVAPSVAAPRRAMMEKTCMVQDSFEEMKFSRFVTSSSRRFVGREIEFKG